MNPTHELAQEAWSEYLDAVSRELLNARVSIEISSGAATQIDEAAPLALQTVGYDRRDDVFELAAAQGGTRLPSLLTHMVDLLGGRIGAVMPRMPRLTAGFPPTWSAHGARWCLWRVGRRWFGRILGSCRKARL